MERKDNILRKFLPILLMVLGFSGYLVVQLGVEMIGKNTTATANRLSDRDGKFRFLESKFKEFRGYDIHKKLIDASNFKESVVVVNFWASWCLPCLKEMPGLVDLQRRFTGKNLRVLGVNCDQENTEKNIIKTTSKYSLNFDSIIDPGNKLLDNLKMTTIPATIIYHKGKVIYFSEEMTDFRDKSLIKKIESLL